MNWRNWWKPASEEQPQTQPETLLGYLLEPRMVFDGAVVATTVEVAADAFPAGDIALQKAIAMMRDTGIPIVVFSIREDNSLRRTLTGEGTFTVIKDA